MNARIQESLGFARIPLAENGSAGILGNMRSSCTALLFLMTVLASAPAQEQREYIVLSGGPSLIEWEKFKDAPHDR
jgi:hypothetical protein